MLRSSIGTQVARNALKHLCHIFHPVTLKPTPNPRPIIYITPPSKMTRKYPNEHDSDVTPFLPHVSCISNHAPIITLSSRSYPTRSYFHSHRLCPTYHVAPTSLTLIFTTFTHLKNITNTLYSTDT
ncbi:uncharacterized protein STEHIDRAFT_163863 [Stereum hirsutum FP-91666 SS1]|uniref:Uncharacterized protein n=1 Tax=Stereum hirsutum (strain FP-91666) TaxID=721885 RepID=R7RVN8_STEHR|nr:uncharacterized protein STEHIDRAFT_163863 [Stereum hirsutum FP-91666 SS1]EIM79196.1 hypothetical protein STEHIDRAFT_163863 [Stereum hirsutum FP-91666 SS1]